jgi:hypothetical protein
MYPTLGTDKFYHSQTSFEKHNQPTRGVTHMFPRYYNLVLGLHPFSGEVSPVAMHLVRQKLIHSVSERQLKEYHRNFVQWVIGRLIFEQFLCVVRNHSQNQDYEEIFQSLRYAVPRIECTFSQCVRSVLRMHQLPDSVVLHYNGMDAYLLKGQDDT